ncbi:PspC domain-containing protein [Pseudarthrobacter sp. YAF2]|uniref:PspC domain-containing protein n=1 Tax=Pseudarthrobacter sp. YAF2 TaxID=3233078 RepID=UPI003F9D4842
MNSQTPSPDDEHPTEPLPGAGSQRPTEPLPASDAVPPGPASSTSERLSGGAQGGPTAPPAADPAQGYAFHASPTPPPPSNDFFGWIRSQGISRGTDRWIGGVCSGIAHRLGVDPIIIRGALVVLTLLAGIGVLLYGLAWALLPEPDGRIHVQEAGAGRWSSGMTGALIATVLGLTGLGGGFWGWSHNGLSGLLWTVFWVAGAIFLIYHLSQRNKARPTMAGYAPAAPGMPYTTGRPGTEHTSSFSAATTSGPTQGFPPAPPYSGGTAGGPAGTGPGAGAPGGTGGPSVPGGGGPGGSGYPAPWVPPRPPKPRPAGPGAPAVAIAAGSALLVGGGLKALDAGHVIDLGGSGNAIVWASAAAVLGLGILVAGLRGRTSGILSLFAVIALITGGVYNVANDSRMRFQQVDWNPASIEEARGGIDITAGRGTVNLTDLSPTAPLTSDVVVPLDITASNVTVVIPQNLPVDIKADMTMGNLNEGTAQRGGTTTRESSYNTDKPGNHLVVQIDGTFSNVTIQEGN